MPEWCLCVNKLIVRVAPLGLPESKAKDILKIDGRNFYHSFEND
jgi:hypothetical protein